MAIKFNPFTGKLDFTGTTVTPPTGVSSFSAGTTGLTPNTATTGAVTLAGTLAIANGGTGGNTVDTARTNLGIVEPQAYTVYEHFLQGNLALNNLRSLTGGSGSAASAVTARQYNSTGVVSLATGTSLVVSHSAIGVDQVNENAIDLSQASRNIFTSRCAFFTLPNAIATGAWYSGFVDNYNTVSTNGAYFRIVNAGNLEAVCVASGVETSLSLGFRPALSEMHLYEVISRNNGSAVDFYYDSVLQTTLLSNIPIGNTRRVNYATGIVRNNPSNATSLEFDLDLVFVRLYNTGFSLNY